MSQFSNQINFKQLLDRHQQVQIPMIQRDYAQGRPQEEEIREDFLSALYDALLLPPEDESLPLVLDFIYGSVEGNVETRFLPLDGQQRLTTLFLLHWYLAWRDDQLADFRQIICPLGFSRFSYSVRTSSTEFFNALVKFCPNVSPDEVPSLTFLITNQSWYFRYWRLDPTIQSSLTMLDSIHQRFNCEKNLFSRLLDESQPAITFELLDLKNFGLSDDLYIKMNARGKPLTSFETFKARFKPLLEEQFDGETRTIDNASVSVADYFARRMDTLWANFFWTHRDKTTNLYDVAVMNLFRAVAIVVNDAESDAYVSNISTLRDKLLKSSFSVFHEKGWLVKRFSSTIIMLLDAWSKDGANFSPQLPSTRYFDETALFNKAVSDPTAIGYTEIVQFVGYVEYLRFHKGNIEPEAFQDWMRIIFNLSVNTIYERPADLQRSVAATLKLVPDSGNILRYFADTERPTVGFLAQQISEEKLKAELIQVNSDWRSLIERGEQHGYFKGQIEFLMEFSGVSEKRRSYGGVNWGADVHATLQAHFESYLDKAERMFNARGLVSVNGCRWERALLSIGDYTLPSGPNRSFLINSSTDQASWKRLLRGTGPQVPEARQVLRQVLECLSPEGALEEQLDNIIHGANVQQSWRKVLIGTSKAIEYCDKRAFRWYSEHEIFLLKTSRIYGAHAELFTFCFFYNTLEPLARTGSFLPLELAAYQSVNGADSDQPHILFTYKHAVCRVPIKIKYKNRSFLISVSLGSLIEIPDVKVTLCDSGVFVEDGEYLVRECATHEIQNILCELAAVLTAINHKDQSNA